MIRNRPIIDPHQHLWDLGRFHYPWLTDAPLAELVADNPRLSENYLLPDFLGDARDLELVKSVHVEANPDPKDSIAETAWLQALADRPESKGFPHGIVALADLRSDDFRDRLTGHARHPNLRGIRQNLNAVPVALMRDETWRKNFGSLAEWNLSFDLHIVAAQMDDAAGLAGANPNVKIALNHTGLPDMTHAEGFDVWRSAMRALARHESISVKLSGFGMLDSNLSPERMRPYILETLELFGTKRCMFASNFPVDRLFVGYRDLWAIYLTITEDFTEYEKSRLFHDNAASFYRL